MARIIPIVNDKFDVPIFLLIVRKTIWWLVIIFILALFSSFAFLRYTAPVFQSVSIIQINDENQTAEILDLKNSFMKPSELPAIIELIRSNEFLKRTLSKLPLEISYYTQGTFLSTELYKSSPYLVELRNLSPELYNTPIYVNFSKTDELTVEYFVNGVKKLYTVKTDTWQKIYDAEIKVTVISFDEINKHQENFKKNIYYFVFNSPADIVSNHKNNLMIDINNADAKTINITYSDYNAAKTTDIVNAISEEMIKYDVEKKKESANKILDFIDDQLRTVYLSLDESEKQLHDFKKSHNLDTSAQNRINTIPIFSTKINDFQNEILKIDFELTSLKRIDSKIKSGGVLKYYDLVTLLSGTKSESVVTKILEEISKLEGDKEQMLYDVTSNNFKIKVIEKQIENKKSLLGEYLSSQIARLTDSKKDYSEKMKDFENMILNKPDKTGKDLEYAKLSRIYSINEGFYHKLIERKAEYLISSAGYVSNNTILQKSDVPKFPIYPKSNVIVLVFIFAALIISLLVLITRYLFFNEITSVSDIKAYTDAPVIGVIPKFKKHVPVSQLLVDKSPKSRLSEAFRNIRSNLQFISNEEGPKILTVSSTVSGEGKTFVAINIAGIIAISGKKVILLDLDLRKPKIHIGFNADNSKGISTILINKHTFQDCLKNTTLENFNYITAGPIPPNPSELIMSKKFDDLIAELKTIYDFVIIDTPPIGLVTDAIINFTRADYPLYIMKSNFSKRTFINNINHLLNEKDIKKISIILNGLDTKNFSYGYGYGYGSGYGYGYGYGYGSGYGYGKYGSGYYDDEPKKEKLSLMKRVLGYFKRTETDTE